MDEAKLRDALRRLRAPGSEEDVVAAGLVEALSFEGGRVRLVLRAPVGEAGRMEAVRQQAETLLRGMRGVRDVSAILTAHRPGPPPDLKPAGPGTGGPQPAPARPSMLQGVKVVAVASGKGGVGKSTTAVNLAVALAQRGLRVGLLDADIYGPSLPRMLGLSGKPQVADGRIVPVEAWGLQAMSVGLLVDPEAAMIWRGPMVMSALEQMLGQVAWGALDAMIVDMPPGTGDAQLTMAQRVQLAGAVVVSTPQDVALIDARRGVAMFAKVMVPVLGLVENMSFFNCPHCGEVTHLFGHGGARQEAARLGVPFLGEVPLLLDIRTTSDAGTPIVAAAPESPAAHAYREIAAALWLGLERPGAAGPSIVVE